MPSVKILEKKKKAVQELRKELENAKSIVFTDYMGLNVAQDTEMRTAFRQEGLKYRVIKNTITTRVFDALGLEEMKAILFGPTAVAYSHDDPVLAPRLVAKYRDQYKKFTIKGGVIDGEAISVEEIEKLAKIPALPILHGQLVSTLLFPISSLAITLNLLAQKAEEEGVEKVAALAVAAENTAKETEQAVAEKEELAAEDTAEEKEETDQPQPEAEEKGQPQPDANEAEEKEEAQE